MRSLRALCRLVFGLTFIFSGFVKLLSPIGTSLIFQEYFSALHLGFLSSVSLYAGMLLAICEFTLGLCILLSVRMKFFTAVGFYLCCFFTLLTLYLALFNPISDCGCFGEAVHLTNWQTFFKNLILLACITPLFLQRKTIPQIAHHAVEWSFAGFFALAAVALWLHSYLYVPMYEFTPYKIGSYVSTDEDEADFVTTFIYEKDGRKENFTLDNLPDSTWTYVETLTEMKGKASKYADFIIQDAEGYDLAPAILHSDDAILISIYDPDKLEDKDYRHLEEFAGKVLATGTEVYFAASTLDPAVPEGFPYEILYADRKLLLTVNRANGGATLFSDSYVGQKWTPRTMKGARLEETMLQDGQTLVLQNAIHHNVLTSCLVLALIVVVILIYYICKITYKDSSLNARKVKNNEKS